MACKVQNADSAKLELAEIAGYIAETLCNKKGYDLRSFAFREITEVLGAAPLGEGVARDTATK